MPAQERRQERRLDGNAAGGALREVFARDVTGGLATCLGCAAVHPVGALLVYAHGMGMVVRCPGCDGAMLRLSRTPGALRLDMSGVRVLLLPDGATAAVPEA